MLYIVTGMWIGAWLLILAHELGHYLEARRRGVWVNTFSVGVGPTLYSFTKNGVVFRLALLPVAGYVGFVGEQEWTVEDHFFPKEQPVPNGIRIKEAPGWHQFTIAFAGPLFSVLFALLALTTSNFIFGIERPSMPLTIGSTVEKTPARTVGLLPGDVILSIDGKVFSAMPELRSHLRGRIGKTAQIRIRRASEERMLSIQVPQNAVIGFLPQTTMMRARPIMSLSSAVLTITDVAIRTGQAIAHLFKFDGQKMGGMISAAKDIKAARDTGMGILLIAGLISLQIGLMNLFPLLPLDGGMILCALFKMIFRREFPESIMQFASNVGFLLLIALTINSTLNDLAGL